MVSWFQKFDVHIKPIEGVNQKTYLGAVLTVISVMVVTFLIVSETRFFLTTDVRSKLITDIYGSQESTVIEFKIEYPAISCDSLSFVQEVTKSSTHSHQPDKYDKTPIMDGKGCLIEGAITTDKVGGNFRFPYSSLEAHDASEVIAPPVDMSHRIHYLYFHPIVGKFESYYASTNTLAQRVNTVAPGLGIHQYVITVVPTEFLGLNRSRALMNEYSVVERHVDEDQCDRVENVGGHTCRDFIGVMFTYEFSPVILVHEEVRGNLWDLVPNLCGIVGGIITVLGLIDRVLYSSVKAVIGKKD